MEPSLIVLDNIIIVCATLIMFNKSTTNDLPILSFKQFLNFGFGLGILLIVPSLKEPHFTVHKRPVTLLTSLTKGLSMFLALIKYSDDSVEDFLDGVEPIASEIGHDISLIGLGVVVALKVEDPEGVKMGMN